MKAKRTCIIGLFALLIFQRGTAFCQDEEGSKLAVHGFLTQAFAISDGNQILGIPEEGTADYRTAALQFRYSLTDNDTFVLQIAHERVGKSEFVLSSGDVELDWVFYEHRFEDETSIKLGKVQVPIGIFNEVRDVGTILPFYRPATDFYGVTSYTTETLDGIVVSRPFFSETEWSTDISVFYGGWNFLETGSGLAGEGDISNAVGFQFWLNTPVQGLRFGYHYENSNVTGGLLRIPGENTDTFNTSYYSIDGDFERFFVRWEAKDQRFAAGRIFSHYAQAGVYLTKKFAITVQRDEANLEFLPFLVDKRVDLDYALSLRYFILSNLVVKAEIHWNKGYASEVPAPQIFEDPLETTYGIISLSTSF